MSNQRRILALMILPTLWLLAIFFFPLGNMLMYSFRDSTFSPAFPLSFKQYSLFLETPAYVRLLISSTGTALLTSIFSILLAYPIAYYLVFYTDRKRVLLLTVLILPAWTSYLLRIVAWKMILGSTGLLNNILVSLGLVETPTPIFLFSRTAVLITLVYVWVPFAALPIFAALERINQSLREAAQDLGANTANTFLRVTLPLSMPGVVSAFFFVFIPTLGEWVTPTMVGGVSGVMYGNLIQDQFVRAINWPMGALLSLVLLILVAGLTWIFNKFFPLTHLAEVS